MDKVKIKYNSVNTHTDGLKLLKELLNKDFELIYNENGKPYLKDNSSFFSISHSDSTVICIVSDKEVGIDIEKIRSYDHKLLTLLNIPDCSDEDFFKEWTQREAYIKCYGMNLQSINKHYNKRYITYVKNGYVISICFK